MAINPRIKLGSQTKIKINNTVEHIVDRTIYRDDTPFTWNYDLQANAKKHMEAIESIRWLMDSPYVRKIKLPTLKRLESIHVLLIRLEARVPMAESLYIADRLPLSEVNRLHNKIRMLNTMKRIWVSRLIASPVVAIDSL